ncbi:hypothetical protein [Psychrobacter pygoscelis]|uniref:hypothetical protein n=1 Tax=Psychrobacter pygoscelis TaxID=2488563 RepID=UPI00103B9758|nr:hypothetical protein [Psychrobacter pygoscelis]
MSIEKTITTLASAIGNVAQAINRYCDLAESNTEVSAPIGKVKIVPPADGSEVEAQDDTPVDEPTETAPVESEEDTVEAEATETAPVETDEEVTFDKAKAVVIDTVRDKGRDIVAKILGEFGVKNIKELEPTQYAELVAKCEAA